MGDNIYLGETLQLSAAFLDARQLAVEPDVGSVKVTVYDPAGVVKVNNQTGEQDPTALNTFKYWYDLASDATPGIWLHKWLATITTPDRVWKVVERKEFLVQTPSGEDP